MKPSVLVTTQNLMIRSYQPEDIDWLHPILSDPVTMAFWPAPLTWGQTAMWIKQSIESTIHKKVGRYAVLDKATGTPIGDCGVLLASVNGQTLPDLGYIIHHPFWGQGLATEAARAIVTHCFENLQMEAVYANMPEEHVASIRVAEKIGMTYLRSFNNPRNRNLPTRLYRIQAQNPKETG